MENKSCIECGDPLRGRSDKKFCCDECRNAYNNRINGDTNKYIRTVNNILKRNRRILEAMMTDNQTRISYDTLLESGFDFRFYTHMITTKKGLKYLFCYEYGYLFIDTEAVMIVRKIDAKQSRQNLNQKAVEQISGISYSSKYELEMRS